MKIFLQKICTAIIIKPYGTVPYSTYKTKLRTFCLHDILKEFRPTLHCTMKKVGRKDMDLNFSKYTAGNTTLEYEINNVRTSR